MNDSDLVAFLQKSKEAFRDPKSVIVVKENVCRDAITDDGTLVPQTEYDTDDSSVVRYVFYMVLRVVLFTHPHSPPDQIWPGKAVSSRLALL